MPSGKSAIAREPPVNLEICRERSFGKVDGFSRQRASERRTIAATFGLLRSALALQGRDLHAFHGVRRRWHDCYASRGTRRMRVVSVRILKSPRTGLPAVSHYQRSPWRVRHGEAKDLDTLRTRCSCEARLSLNEAILRFPKFPGARANSSPGEQRDAIKRRIFNSKSRADPVTRDEKGRERLVLSVQRGTVCLVMFVRKMLHFPQIRDPQIRDTRLECIERNYVEPVPVCTRSMHLSRCVVASPIIETAGRTARSQMWNGVKLSQGHYPLRPTAYVSSRRESSPKSAPPVINLPKRRKSAIRRYINRYSATYYSPAWFRAH